MYILYAQMSCATGIDAFAVVEMGVRQNAPWDSLVTGNLICFREPVCCVL